MRYGVKNEAKSAEQRSLSKDDVLQDISAVEAEHKLSATSVTPRTRAGRQDLPEHLERVDMRHKPARFFVICHIRRHPPWSTGQSVAQHHERTDRSHRVRSATFS